VVSVGNGVRDAVAVPAAVRDGGTLRVGVAVRVTDGDSRLVTVAVGLGPGVWVRVRVPVALDVTVGAGVPVRVGVPLRVGDADAVATGVSVARALAVDVAEPVAAGVSVWVSVTRVLVAVRAAAMVAVAVGRGVTVTSGSLPTRRTICAGALAVPATSRTRAVTIVAPPGKASTDDTDRRTAPGTGSTNRCAPNESIVQAWNGFAANSKRHPISLRPVEAGARAKLGGAQAPLAADGGIAVAEGIGDLHLEVEGNSGRSCITVWPIGIFAGPGMASITSRNPLPLID
jgi:hypothetical protein